MTNKYSVDFIKQVYHHLGQFTKSSWISSIYHFIITVFLFFLCLQLKSAWFSPFFALLYVRIFIIFHDMAHNTFFPNKTLNWITGLIFGTITFTPQTKWIENHTYHHSNCNKLDEIQVEQTAPLSLEKYLSFDSTQKNFYKLVYGKYTLFTIVPSVFFMIHQRFLSQWYELLIQLIYFYALYLYLDPSQYLYFGLSFTLAGIFGFLLFHIQHTFDDVYRAHGHESDDEQKWNYFNNGMDGSSFLQVPWYLRFFTCNIEYHHIHHLNSHIPFYRLSECHHSAEHLFSTVKRVYLFDIFRTLHYSLYDSKEKRFIDVYKYD